MNAPCQPTVHEKFNLCVDKKMVAGLEIWNLEAFQGQQKQSLGVKTLAGLPVSAQAGSTHAGEC